MEGAGSIHSIFDKFVEISWYFLMMTQLHEVGKAIAMVKTNDWFPWLATSHIGDGLLRCSLLPIHRDGDSIVLGVLKKLWEGGSSAKKSVRGRRDH